MDALRFALLVMVGFTCRFVSGTSDSPRFDSAFRRFLHDNDYTGGAVAALKDGRLLLAKGYGVTGEGVEVKAGSRFPVSSLSKSVTAVAVLRLVQQGLLDLTDPVFGTRGVLHMIRPLDPAKADPRLEDITVAHLLRHSAGWDHSVAPLFDPVLNEVYQSRGHAVPSIAQAMNVSRPLDFYTLARYAISQPLHYTPGTRVVYSNLGYLLLGRVVEETTTMMYEDYVKKFVLTPCGMWHTRLGSPASLKAGHKLEDDVAPKDTPPLERKQLGLLEVLDPLNVDAALGWYSTVYDMARFSRCVFDGDQVLNDASLETLLERQDSAPVRHSDSWLCAGFRTNTRGAVWQDGDPHADDVILYHDLLADRSDVNPLPDTWVVLLHGSRLHHLQHKTRDLMKGLERLARQASSSLENRFAPDLSDLNAARAGDDVLVKFSVDEHHLDAYVSAVKQEGYDVRWVSPYTHHHHTYFIIISRRTAGGLEPEEDFTLEHGLGEQQLLTRKLSMERRDYNLTFLQSYHSQSHLQPRSFLAIFRKHAYSTDTQLKFGTDHLPEPYDKLVQMYQEKRFHPLVQSLLPDADRKEERMTFVFLQTPHSRPVHFKNYYRLTDTKLEKVILQNADRGRTLSFLDAYQMHSGPRFAAVFTNETKPRWHFQGGLGQSQATLLLESRLAVGLWPALMAAFTDKDQQLKFAIFLRSDEEARQYNGQSLLDHSLSHERAGSSRGRGLSRDHVDGSRGHKAGGPRGHKTKKGQ